MPGGAGVGANHSNVFGVKLFLRNAIGNKGYAGRENIMGESIALGKKEINDRKDLWFALGLCAIFALIELLVIPYEIVEDPWLVESMADGLFGAENRNLVSLTTHYLMSGLIYILSLTGIRLHWFNLLLMISHILSSYLAMRIFLKLNHGRFRRLQCILYLMMTAPLLWGMDMTVGAAYGTAVAWLVIFYSIEYEQSQRMYFLGLFLLAFCFSFRMDSLYFSIAVFGILGFSRIVSIWWNERLGLKKWLKRCRRYFIWAGGALVCVLTLRVTHNILVDAVHKDFPEWNFVRGVIDNYEIPDYFEYQEQYQELGLTYNDYQLLCHTDYQDPEFFTEEKLTAIYELVQQHKEENIVDQGMLAYMKQAVKTMASYVQYAYLFLLFLVLLALLEKKNMAAVILVCVVCHVLALYFCLRGRFIYRIVMPLLLTWMVVMNYLLASEEKKQFDSWQLPRRVAWVGMAGIFSICFFFRATANSNSLFNQYKNSLVTAISRFQGCYESKTMAPSELSERIFSNKDHLYYVLMSTLNGWRQNYPIPAVSPFVTMEEGTCSNVAYLGEYMVRLGINDAIQTAYGVDNPFRDLVNSNVRVVTRGPELHTRVNYINTYLKQHYYDNVDFSIEKVYDTVTIVRFLEDKGECEALESSVEINHVRVQDSEYEGMKEIIFKMDGEDERVSDNKLYVQLIDKGGKSYTYSVLQEEERLKRVVIRDGALKKRNSYEMKLLLEQDGECKQIGKTVSIRMK